MHTKFFKKLIFIILLFCGLSSSTEATELQDVDIAVSRLQKSYDKAVSLSADFMQITYNSASVQGTTAYGKVWFKRPCLMRWEYSKPEEQLIVTSGSNVYVYEKEAAQVTVMSRENLLSTEISKAFFLGNGDISKSFKVALNDRKSVKKFWRLVLVPREHNPQIQKIDLTVDKNSGLINEMWIENLLGGKTRLVFTDIVINPEIEKQMFNFSIPKGVEVFRAD